MLIMQSKVRAVFKDAGKRVQKEAIEAVDRKVLEIVQAAIKNSMHFKTVNAFEVERIKILS